MAEGTGEARPKKTSIRMSKFPNEASNVANLLDQEFADYIERNRFGAILYNVNNSFNRFAIRVYSVLQLAHNGASKTVVQFSCSF